MATTVFIRDTAMPKQFIMLYTAAMKKKPFISRDVSHKNIVQHKKYIYIQAESTLYSYSNLYPAKIPVEVGELGKAETTSILRWDNANLSSVYFWLPGPISRWKFVSFLYRFPALCDSIVGIIESLAFAKRKRQFGKSICKLC